MRETGTRKVLTRIFPTQMGTEEPDKSIQKEMQQAQVLLLSLIMPLPSPHAYWGSPSDIRPE